MATVRTCASDELRPEEVLALRELFADAWAEDPDQFTDDDWAHTQGGVHFLLEEGGDIVAHAAVVERELHTSGHRLATGYVEAVATRRSHQRRGYGTAVMRAVDEHIDGTFRLGGLDTGSPSFYERLGWVIWRGPTFVRTTSGLVRTAEDDGSVLVRPTPTSPKLDLTGSISCDWRSGDVW